MYGFQIYNVLTSCRGQHTLCRLTYYRRISNAKSRLSVRQGRFPTSAGIETVVLTPSRQWRRLAQIKRAPHKQCVYELDYCIFSFNQIYLHAGPYRHTYKNQSLLFRSFLLSYVPPLQKFVPFIDSSRRFCR